MSVSAGITVAWAGAASAIPAGWARAAALNGFYLRGAAASADPGATGGSATHSHTSTAHSHNIAPHTHLVGGVPDLSGSAVLNVSAPGGTLAYTHQHVGQASGLSASDALGSAIFTWAATNNDPAYVTVLWIQSDGTPVGLPAFALALWPTAALPAGWLQHPAFKAAYAKAAVTGADGGIAGGSSQHTHLGGNHSHSVSAGHTHTTTTPSGAVINYTGVLYFVGTQAVPDPSLAHTHTVTSPTGSQTSTADLAVPGANANQAGDPPYYTLVYAQNASGSTSLPPSIIAVWINTLASIPAGWVLCDGTNGTPDLRTKFVRGANALGDVGTTGGAVGHAHPTGAGHTHPVAAHSHTTTFGSTNQGAGTVSLTNGSTVAPAAVPHAGHSGTDALPVTTDSTPADTQATADTRPPFYDVAYIQYQATGTVSVTTPAAASTQTTPFFTAVWALSGGRAQASYHVVIYENDGVTVHWDSGVVNSASVSVQVPTAPSGPPYPTQQLPGLQNGASYKFQVTTVDTNGVSSISSLISFTAAWTTPVELSGVTTAPVGGS